jgi:hypothetical protein
VGHSVNRMDASMDPLHRGYRAKLHDVSIFCDTRAMCTPTTKGHRLGLVRSTWSTAVDFTSTQCRAVHGFFPWRLPLSGWRGVVGRWAGDRCREVGRGGDGGRKVAAVVTGQCKVAVLSHHSLPPRRTSDATTAAVAAAVAKVVVVTVVTCACVD